MSDLARKYRPHTLNDVIGQSVVVRVLSNAMTNNKLKQAYLFVGSPGTGKTTSARIMAAMENCDRPGLTPCGICEACSRIFEGKHPDVCEIDAASNAGSVDAIRLLKTEASYNPIDGARVKYFIIDECLPYESKIVIDGSAVKIGEVIEQWDRSKEHYIRGKDSNSGKEVDRKIINYIRIVNDKQMYEIDVRGEDGKIRTIRVTGNHNVFLNDMTKVKAQDLKVGDNLIVDGE